MASAAAASEETTPVTAPPPRAAKNSFIIGANSRITADMCVVVGDNLSADAPYSVCVGPLDWARVTEKLPTSYQDWIELLGQITLFMDMHLARNPHTGKQAVAALTVVLYKLSKIMTTRMRYAPPRETEEEKA